MRMLDNGERYVVRNGTATVSEHRTPYGVSTAIARFGGTHIDIVDAAGKVLRTMTRDEWRNKRRTHVVVNETRRRLPDGHQ